MQKCPSAATTFMEQCALHETVIICLRTRCSVDVIQISIRYFIVIILEHFPESDIFYSGQTSRFQLFFFFFRPAFSIDVRSALRMRFFFNPRRRLFTCVYTHIFSFECLSVSPPPRCCSVLTRPNVRPAR